MNKPKRTAKASSTPRKPAPKRTKRTQIPRSDGRPGKPNDTSWHEGFLAALRCGKHVDEACKAAGVSDTSAYEHREKFPVFAVAWETARRVGRKMRADDIEDRFLDRLRHGVPAFTGSGEPILDPKTKVQCREYQDTVVLKALAALTPEVFSEKKKVELSGKLTMTDEEVTEASQEAHESLLLTMAGGLNGSKAA